MEAEGYIYLLAAIESAELLFELPKHLHGPSTGKRGDATSYIERVAGTYEK